MAERVTRMEHCMDRVMRALQEGGLPHVQAEIAELKAYQESGQWLEDYDRDARGEFPADLKRGVLSQDTLYDLLREIEQKDKS